MNEITRERLEAASATAVRALRKRNMCLTCKDAPLKGRWRYLKGDLQPPFIGRCISCEYRKVLNNKCN